MSSMTRIYNRCLKTANIPEDCEAINMTPCVCVCVRAHVCMCTGSLHILGPLGDVERDFLFFFKNQERLLDETKDRGYLDSRKSMKRYETKFLKCSITYAVIFQVL